MTQRKPVSLGRNQLAQSRCTTDQVGDISLIGAYNGAICYHYRLERFEGNTSVWIRVKSVQIKNTDGTFSSKWESAT